jgi:choline-sulfatase
MTTAPHSRSDRPNILWLFTDQHRADTLGCYGDPVVQTPSLDALAASGTVFQRAYCQGPVCVPARVSLLTGRYVRDHGAFENDYPCDPELPTFLQSIRSVGYDTVALGKMHLYPHGHDVADSVEHMRSLGFTEVHEEVGKLAAGYVTTGYTRYLAERGLLDTYREFVRERSPLVRMAGALDADMTPKPTWTVDPTPLPPEHYVDTYVGRRAEDWLRSRDSDDPFFLWVGFPGPHDPWDAPAEYVDKYRDAPIALDSTQRPEIADGTPLGIYLKSFLEYSSSDSLTDERIREVRRHYYANVTLIDDAIGRILAVLQERGLDENTWVIYSTDHGEMLGTHGFLNKMVFYEPAVRVPLIVRPPSGVAAQTRHSDELVEHVDLTATFCDIADAPAVAAGAGRSLLPLVHGQDWATREAVVSENYGFGMWRTDRFKLVVYEATSTPVQLFDLDKDPQENINVLDDPAYGDDVDDLMARFVRPFLSIPPRRPGPDVVERGGRLGLGHPLDSH